MPGPDHSVEPGQRQYNVVWYHPVREAEDLPRFMTDDNGRYHPNGIPPSLLSTRIRDEMIGRAQQVLAPQFAGALERGRLHFFQPILDIEPRAPGVRARRARRRCGIRGAPACGHGRAQGRGRRLGAGASDWSALPATSRRAMQQFETERLRVGRILVARGRYLGAYMEAQLKSDEERRQAEARRVPEQVMMETAAPSETWGQWGQAYTL